MPSRFLLSIFAAGALACGAIAGVAVVSAASPTRPQVLVVHGGGWTRTGPSTVARMTGDARRLRAWGYEPTVIDYRPGPMAFPDVLAAYDRLRARVGNAVPICLLGSSAGAHMSLLVAERRPDVRCVISHAAPTDLQALSPNLTARARVSFDRLGGLAANSPALHRFTTPLLLEQGADDPVVPICAARDMHAAAPGSELIVLPPGRARFTHTRVDAGALAVAQRRERRFLARWASAG